MNTIWTRVKKAKDSTFKGSFVEVVEEVKKGNNIIGIQFDSGKLGFVFGEEVEIVVEENIPSMKTDDVKKKEYMDDGFEHIVMGVPVYKGMLEYAKTQVGATKSASSVEEIFKVGLAVGMKQIKDEGGVVKWSEKMLPVYKESALKKIKEYPGEVPELLNVLKKAGLLKDEEMDIEISGSVNGKFITGDEAKEILKKLLNGEDPKI